MEIIYGKKIKEENFITASLPSAQRCPSGPTGTGNAPTVCRLCSWVRCSSPIQGSCSWLPDQVSLRAAWRWMNTHRRKWPLDPKKREDTESQRKKVKKHFTYESQWYFYTRITCLSFTYFFFFIIARQNKKTYFLSSVKEGLLGAPAPRMNTLGIELITPA